MERERVHVCVCACVRVCVCVPENYQMDIIQQLFPLLLHLQPPWQTVSEGIKFYLAFWFLECDTKIEICVLCFYSLIALLVLF